VCRHLAYLGPPVALSTLLFDAPHALATQSRHPRYQPAGRTNPDGWGVTWYAAGTTEPARYRSTTAIWDDAAFDANAVRSGAIVAAARLASPGTTLDERNNAPFVSRRWCFSLNGFAFRDGRGPRLRDALSPARTAALEGDTDSEVLFGLVLDRIDDGADAADALRDVTVLVDPDDDVRLNLLLSDGASVAATAWGNSLFVHDHGDRLVVASEPLDDDPAWEPVADRSVVSGPPFSRADLGGRP
jgi:gamma-glutamyl hercynylcysteine S-oxide hydrolase